MVSWIQFHFNSKYLITVILFPLFYCLREYLYTTIIESDKIKDIRKYKSNPIFFTLLMFFGELTCGIFEIIKVYRAKSNKMQKSSNNQINYRRSRCIEFVLFLIIVSIDITVYTTVNVIIEDKFKQYESLSPIIKMIEIIALGILSSQILNNPLHRHQIICIILFIIIIVISIILEGFILYNYQDPGKPFSIEFYCITIITDILLFTVNSFQYIFEKYVMDQLFYSPYLLLTYSGGIGIIFVFALISFSEITNFDWNFEFVFGSLFHYTFDNWMLIFVIYICDVLVNASLMTTVQQLTPQHVGIGNSLSSIILIIALYMKGDLYLKIFKYVLFFIIFVACLLYTEIIVLNIFSLGDYTKNEIDKRGSRETKKMEKITSNLFENEIEEEFEE